MPQGRSLAILSPKCMHIHLEPELYDMTLLYKMLNRLTPEYTIDPIPHLQRSHYSLRNQDIIGRIRTRTEKFKSSFYPDCLAEWNKLDAEIRFVPSFANFKNKLISKIAPPQLNLSMGLMKQKNCPI